jgi:hypothetical protein
MEMAVRSMETAETAMETDGDGSEGTAPSRQGAKTETSVPRNSSAVVAELRNSFWKIADSPRVFCPEALYRRRGVVRGLPGRPHNGSLSVFGTLPGKIRLLELVSSNSENISCVAFLKYKNSRKQGTATLASCQ